MHSFIADFLSQLGQLGTDRSLSAPPTAPDSALLIRGGGGGVEGGGGGGLLGVDTPTGVPPTEFPGEVLSTCQEDFPPRKMPVHALHYVRLK